MIVRLIERHKERERERDRDRERERERDRDRDRVKEKEREREPSWLVRRARPRARRIRARLLEGLEFGIGVWCLVFGVWCLRFELNGSGFRVHPHHIGSGLRVCCLVFVVWGSESGVCCL